MTKPRVLHPLPAAGATETDAERGRHREPPQASQAEESESIFIICQVEIKYSWGFLLGTQRTPDLQKTRGDLLGPQQMDMTRSSPWTRVFNGCLKKNVSPGFRPRVDPSSSTPSKPPSALPGPGSSSVCQGKPRAHLGGTATSRWAFASGLQQVWPLTLPHLRVTHVTILLETPITLHGPPSGPGLGSSSPSPLPSAQALCLCRVPSRPLHTQGSSSLKGSALPGPVGQHPEPHETGENV